MEVEHIGEKALSPQTKRFHCNKCGSQFLATGDGIEWFEKTSPKYMNSTYIAYCPICRAEVKKL